MYLFTFKECQSINDGGYIDNEFYDVFMLKSDFDINQITMQAEEVQAVKYIKYDDFKKIVISQDKSFWQHKVGYKMLLAALDDFYSSFS